MSRVLIVDDDPACRAVLRLELARAGHDVWMATNERQALVFGAENHFDALVVDMHLRGEHDGIEVGRQMLRLLPEATVVLVTGWEGPVDLRDLPAQLVRKTLGAEFAERVLDLVSTAAER